MVSATEHAGRWRGVPVGAPVAVICLATGAALDAAIGAHSGKGSGELSLFRSLTANFAPGDVMLADALYCNYFLIATLARAKVDVLFEQNGSRITDFRRGTRLGARDHLVVWSKPARPQWMTHEEYRAFPDELQVRETKTDHQILVTTMPSAREIRAAAMGRFQASAKACISIQRCLARNSQWTSDSQSAASDGRSGINT